MVWGQPKVVQVEDEEGNVSEVQVVDEIDGKQVQVADDCVVQGFQEANESVVDEDVQIVDASVASYRFREKRAKVPVENVVTSSEEESSWEESANESSSSKDEDDNIIPQSSESSRRRGCSGE